MDYDFRVALCKNMYVGENVTRRVTNARLFIIRSASRAVIWRHLNFYCLQGRGFYDHFLDVKFLSSAFLFVLRFSPAAKVTRLRFFRQQIHNFSYRFETKFNQTNNDRAVTHNKIYNVWIELNHKLAWTTWNNRLNLTTQNHYNNHSTTQRIIETSYNEFRIQTSPTRTKSRWRRVYVRDAQ